MAYDENIRIIAEELERVKNRPTGDKLPEVESTDEGKVLTVNSSGKWVAADPTSSYDLDYSTTEVNTGKKWIDGSDIYQKTIIFEESITGSGNTWLNTNININYIDILLNGIAYASGIPYNVSVSKNTNMLDFMHFRDAQPSFTGLTIQYTKTTHSKKKGVK